MSKRPIRNGQRVSYPDRNGKPIPTAAHEGSEPNSQTGSLGQTMDLESTHWIPSGLNWLCGLFANRDAKLPFFTYPDTR